MTQREYTWSSIFAWGLTLSGAVLATGGVIGMFWPQLEIGWLCIIAFAGMMAFGIGLVNCSAAGALQAIKHRKPDGRQVEWAVLVPALACCLGFVFATNVGVHLGWEIVTSNAPVGAKLPPTTTVDAVFYIFAFAKPAMAWIVEGRKTMDAEDFAARQAMRRQEAAEIAAALDPERALGATTAFIDDALAVVADVRDPVSVTVGIFQIEQAILIQIVAALECITETVPVEIAVGNADPVDFKQLAGGGDRIDAQTGDRLPRPTDMAAG